MIVLLSGGIDSSTLLYRTAKEGIEDIVALSFNYGQKHERKELTAAKLIARAIEVEHIEVNISAIKPLLSSALTDFDKLVPDGIYDIDNMADTVVPNRNMIMLSIAVATAISRGDNTVAYAAHAGDHTVYSDCRPAFVSAMQRAIDFASDHKVILDTPYITYLKSAIVAEAHTLGVPLGLTYSCYKGGEKHCGVCSTCRERKKAFIDAHVHDPTEYEK